MKLFFLLCGASALYICNATCQTAGQTSPVTASVQFNDGQTATVTDFSGFVGVHPNEAVTITVHFPVASAGTPMVVDLADGGISGIGSSIPVVAADGSATFAFVARAKPGRNSIVVRAGQTSVILQLWVIDSANPQNNPPSMIAVSNG